MKLHCIDSNYMQVFESLKQNKEPIKDNQKPTMNTPIVVSDKEVVLKQGNIELFS